MATTLGRGPQTIKACEGISQRPVIDVDSDPRESITTVAVLLAVSAGYRWGIPKPYLDLYEELSDGTIQRRVHWIFDAASEVGIEGERLVFGEFWARLHDTDLSRARSTMHQLAQGLAILDGVFPRRRAERLRYWAGHVGISETAQAIFAEAATVYEEFLASRMPSFIYVEQARGMETHRAYIPIHATPEERAEVLARAGIT